MWQQIDPTNPRQVLQAVNVLKEHDNIWRSAQELQEWMLARDVRFFYYQGPDYELVIGFEHFATPDEWRLRTGGARGNLVAASGRQMADKIVEFMKSEALPEVAMYSQLRSRADPRQVLLGMGVDLLRQHPDVADVNFRPSSIGRRYNIVLR